MPTRLDQELKLMAYQGRMTQQKIPFLFEFLKYLRYKTLTLTKRLMLFGKGSCVIQSSKPTDIKYNHRRQNYLKNKFKKCQVAYYKVF